MRSPHPHGLVGPFVAHPDDSVREPNNRSSCADRRVWEQSNALLIAHDNGTGPSLCSFVCLQLSAVKESSIRLGRTLHESDTCGASQPSLAVEQGQEEGRPGVEGIWPAWRARRACARTTVRTRSLWNSSNSPQHHQEALYKQANNLCCRNGLYDWIDLALSARMVPCCHCCVGHATLRVNSSLMQSKV